jgi:hypothetical protein
MEPLEDIEAVGGNPDDEEKLRVMPISIAEVAAHVAEAQEELVELIVEDEVISFRALCFCSP